MRVPKISGGVLGRIIVLIKDRIMTKNMTFEWVPDLGKNAGSAISFFKVNGAMSNGIEVTGFRVTVTEGKRSQLIHELVHCLDVSYYFYNVDHPPLSSWQEKRYKYLAIDKLGQIVQFGVMMGQLQANEEFTTPHENSLVDFITTARNNNLLKQWQWEMLVKQLEYAKQSDKLHVEFTANVAQCLSLLYQWGFTGNEKSFLGNPRTIALMIGRMELVLQVAINNWENYAPPQRDAGSVYQIKEADAKPELGGRHYFADKWWETVEEPLIPGILEPLIPGVLQGN